ncbi:MAG: RnfH family protein [Halorhodospira sp.]
MSSEQSLRIEVAYALPDQQSLIPVTLPAGGTAEEAIRASGILERHPEIDLSRQSVGVFGQVVGLDTPLYDGDRVEIYRPLRADPKEARKRRAARKG